MCFNFEKLIVYQKSIEFVNNIYTVTKKFPREEIFGIVSQLRRAAVSIPLNIAEGSGRPTKRDKIHFFHIARSSVFECVPILIIAKKQKYITGCEYNSLYKNCIELSKIISGLIKSVER